MIDWFNDLNDALNSTFNLLYNLIILFQILTCSFSLHFKKVDLKERSITK
jgi:hypothetical protein